MPFLPIDNRSHFESLRTRQAEKGFTLVEIMIAVVLLAAAGALWAFLFDLGRAA